MILNHEELVMKTLDEIRAENKAAEESATKTQTPAIEQDDLEADDLGASEPPKAEAPERPKSPDSGKPKAEDNSQQEDWMAEDDAKDDKSVPLSAHISLRTKLKDKVREKDSEIEQLKAELAQIKQAVVKPTATADDPKTVLKPPVPQNFRTVEEYQAAVEQYTDAKLEQRLSLIQQTQNASARQESAKKAKDDLVNAHYQRAAELVKANSISPEVYQNADLKVREAVATVFKDSADGIVDDLIASLGDGSERVMYYLGRNAQARNTLISKLLSDGRGIDASVYLGELKAQKAGNLSSVSSMAPAPSPRVRGQSGTTGSDAEALKKQYEAAHKKGDVQAAFNLKRQAKAAGITFS